MLSPNTLQRFRRQSWEETLKLNSKSSLLSAALVVTVIFFRDGLPFTWPQFSLLLAGFFVINLGLLRYFLTRVLSKPESADSF